MKEIIEYFIKIYETTEKFSFSNLLKIAITWDNILDFLCLIILPTAIFQLIKKFFK